MVGFISIYKGDSLEVKIEIYHETIGMIIKDIFKSLFSYIVVLSRTVLEKAVVENLLMICADGRI